MDHPLPYQRLTTMTLYRLIVIHTQTICELEVRAAKYGIDQPIALMHQRADTKMIISQIEAEVVRRGHNPAIPLDKTTQTWRPLVMAPRPPDTFVARPAEFSAVLATMLDGSQNPFAITIALQGAGGFGKTTLAAALCHTPAVINAFPDGILWVTLGEQPNLLEVLATLVEQVTTERPIVVNEEHAAIKLAECLEDRRCLVVLDDVWHPHHLHPFLRGITHCTWLITTRITSVAAATSIIVDTMTPTESLQLLTNRLPTPPSDLTIFRGLTRRLGEWPLLLELAGAALHARISRGEALDVALQSLEKLLDKRGVVAFDQRHPRERQQAVASTLAASLNLLSDSEQTAYRDLVVFPEDVDVPLVTLSHLWDLDEADTEDLALHLDTLSLLKINLHTRTIRLHDVIRAFLVHQTGRTISTLHSRLLDHYQQLDWADLPHDELYLWRHLVYHLLGAERHSELFHSVTNLRYLATKTFLFGAAPVEQDLRVVESTNPNDAVVALLTHTFCQIAHLLTRCTNLPDLEATLASRLQQHMPLGPVLDPLLSQLRPPFLMPWQPLPDTPESALLRTLAGHTGGVIGCAISADGTVIISASADNTLKVWDTATGTDRATLKGHIDWVRGCAISADGTVIVSASRDGTLKIWDTTTGTEHATLVGHTSEVNGCAISADGTVIVSASRDGTLKVWDPHTGHVRATLAGHMSQVRGCAISADGALIVSASDDGTLKLWDVATFTERATLVGHTDVVIDCAISADGSVIVSVSYDKTLKVWDSATFTERASLKGHTTLVSGCAISADGTVIISASGGGILTVWDAHTGHVRASVKGVRGCAISGDGAVIISASDDKTLQVWDAATLIERAPLAGHTREVTGCAISADGDLIISASADRTLRVWDAATGTERATLKGHTDVVWNCAINKELMLIISTLLDGTMKVWDLVTFTERATLVGHTSAVTSCEISPDGTVIVSTSADRTVRVWDVATFTERTILKGHPALVIDCAISADGAVIVSASWDYTLKVWDAATGTERTTLQGHTDMVMGCAISADGTFIVSASADNTLKVWDAATGTERATLKGHTDWVRGCAISFDGRLIVSVSADRTLKIWIRENAQCLATFHADGGLYDCVWHPDGEHLVAGGAKGLYFLRFIP